MKPAGLLNYLIERLGHQSYLEIGCKNDRTFRRITLEDKVGVDPRRGGTIRATSDDFFRENARHFDLVFVDGLHLAEQCERDIVNALKWLTPRGCVVVHDCLPRRPDHQERQKLSRSWTGDVWKAFARVRTWGHVDACVLDVDWGLGVILPRPNSSRLEELPARLDWGTFVQHGRALLRVVDFPGLERFLERGDQ